MDGKRRDDLEQNELAKWFNAQYEDWIKPNSGWLGYAVLGTIIVIVILMVTHRVNSSNLEAAWKQYYIAKSSVDANVQLEYLANSTSSVVGAHARLALAQRQLEEGSRQVFIDRDEAIVTLEKAILSFRQVEGATRDPMLLQQAVFGLGQCWETLAAARVGDDLARAEEEYQRVLDRWEDGFMAQRAERHLALIRQPSTRMFLELTATYVPEPPEFEIPWGVTIDPDTPFTPGQIHGSPFDIGSPTDFGALLDAMIAEQVDEQTDEIEQEAEGN